MNTLTVFVVVVAAYLLTCIRAWRKIDRAALPTEKTNDQAGIDPQTWKAAV